MILAVGALALCALVAPQREDPIEPILDAIRVVETGGEPNEGRDAVGDGGRSIGPFQIQRAYWYDSGVEGRWEDCRDNEYARRVVRAYWLRYCPRAYERADAQVLARIHNGGSTGHRKTSTLSYWRRVEGELSRARARAERVAAARSQPRSGPPVASRGRERTVR